MAKIRLILFFGFTFLISLAYGQKSIIKQANAYFEKGKYQDALTAYNQVVNIEKNRFNVYRKAMSNLHTSHYSDALRDFTMARNGGYEHHDIYLSTAKALQGMGEYADAAKFYKNYLRYVENKNEQNLIVDKIRQCKYALDHKYDSQLAFVENMGGNVNTIADEFLPVLSPTNHNKYYFSSNRPGSEGGLRNAKGLKDEIYGSYFSDMYAVELKDGNWTSVSAFHPILNGPKNEMIQGFSPDGEVLYFIEGLDVENGILYSDTFANTLEEKLFPKSLQLPVISELGDNDLQVFNNNILIFSSRRAGGYGGRDLYISIRKDSLWSIPINMGPKINSAYDEVSPFLTKSGMKLYYSSNRVESFGGFDVFSNTYDIYSSQWKDAENLGLPINTPSDEVDFSVSADGMTAVLSSNREGGHGGKDIYLVYFKDQVYDQLIYTENLIFINVSDSTNVVEAVIDTPSPKNTSEPKIAKKEFFNAPLYYDSNEQIVSSTNIPKLNRVKDLMVVYPELKVVFLGNSIKEGTRDFDLYFSLKRAEKAAAYLIENGIEPNRIHLKGLGSNFPHTAPESNIAMAGKNNRRIDVQFINIPEIKLEIKDERPIVSDQFYDGASERLTKFQKGLSYRIVVAKTSQMFKSDILQKYTDAIVEKRVDGSQYTYTIGLFDNYNQARALKNELVRVGANDAVLTPYIDGIGISRLQAEGLRSVYKDLEDYLKFE